MTTTQTAEMCGIYAQRIMKLEEEVRILQSALDIQSVTVRTQRQTITNTREALLHAISFLNGAVESIDARKS